MKTLMEIKKKKRVLLMDEASNWLQIWTAAPSLDVKGNKAIKNEFFSLANQLVFPNTVTHRLYNKTLYISMVISLIYIPALKPNEVE